MVVAAGAFDMLDDGADMWGAHLQHGADARWSAAAAVLARCVGVQRTAHAQIPFGQRTYPVCNSAWTLRDTRHESTLRAAERLRELAARQNARPATLALAFALGNPLVASALFGATQPTQVAGTAAATEVLGTLDGAVVVELRNIGLAEVACVLALNER